MVEDGRELQRRWGCPGACDKRVTLEPDLAAEARHAARVTDTPEAETCPFACITYADPWVVDITRAVMLATDWHVPITETLGRELTRADIEALAALKTAQREAWESDRAIEEKRRKADEAKRRSGSGGAR